MSRLQLTQPTLNTTTALPTENSALTFGYFTKKNVGDSVEILITGAFVLPNITGGTNQSVGVQLFTIPPGVEGTYIAFEQAQMNCVITSQSGNITSDTPEIGLGTALAAGSNATLSTTQENILNSFVMPDCNGTPALSTTVKYIIQNSSTIAVNLNVADGWAAGGDSAATVTATIIMRYRQIKLI